MKRTTLLLTLALGVSTLSALGQSQGDQASQLKNAPSQKDGDEVRKQDRRADERRMRRGDGPRKQREQVARRQMRGAAPAPYGPQQPLEPGQGFGGQRRGMAGRAPLPDLQGPLPEFCPHCNRPLAMGSPRGPQFRGRQGAAPRSEVEPMQPGLGPQARRRALDDKPMVNGGRPVMRGQQPIVPPVVAVFDANHDGVIDEREIEHAGEALKKLDKNADGKVTLDELRPLRPDGAPGVGPNRGLGTPPSRRGPGGPPVSDDAAPRPTPER